MPGLVSTPLQAKINFIVPKSKISQADQARYLERYDINDLPPKETVTVPLYDLRSDFDKLPSPVQQLDAKGYAAIKHTSAYASVEGLKSVETTNSYLRECCDLYKEILGADEVIAWNSVIRSNDESGSLDLKEARQKAVEKDAPPADNVKTISASAHVDQDEEYARAIAIKAAGERVFEEYRRVQIVNLWRPLRGPVTNAPLAVCDYRSMDVENDLMRFAGGYGTAFSVSHSPGQRWSYISHQQPDEVLLLRCYDSAMGAEGQALFSAHTAVEVIDEALPVELEGSRLVPRTSVEVRLVVLHK